MSTSTAVHITFGRNVNTEPMSDEKWADFIETVRKDLTLTLTILGAERFDVETHTGIGTYDGITEESAKVSAYFEGELPEDFQKALKVCLRSTALRFKQDAIALSIGQSELVTARS